MNAEAGAAPLSLLAKQQLFAQCVCELLEVALSRGYRVTFGDAYRSPEEAARLAGLGSGIRNSVHTLRLAIDLNLFKDGVYLQQTEDYRELGQVWKGLHPLCRWGGDFNSRKDGNHFSIEHDGRA